MKSKVIVALLGLCVVCVSCYDDELEILNNRVDKIENEKIASVSEQVASISTSVLDLQRVDNQLNGYITALQGQAEDLQETLSAVDTRISQVEKGLKDGMASQKTQVLSELNSYKTLVAYQISAINTSISTLQQQKTALAQEVEALEGYVDSQIKGNKDWASATFATLAKHNELAGIVTSL